MRLIPRAPSRRWRMIFVSVIGTVAGTAGLTWLALWVAMARNTDLADAAASITASDKHAAAPEAAAPLQFTDVAAEAGLAMRHGPGPRRRSLPEDTGSGLAWADFDNDRDWDLYVVNFPDAQGRGGSNHLFRNDGGKFTDVAEQAGVNDPGGFGMGASWADYDDDGWVDLYVTNYGGPNRLFHNRGNGMFDEVGAQAGVADALWSTGVAWGDVDRDGLLDLYVCNYVDYFDAPGGEQETAVESSGAHYSVPFTLNPNSFDPVPNRLYRNRGNGTFEEVARQFGVDNPDGRSFAATLVDLDGDGWLDLYVANDVSTNKLYRNVLGEFSGGGPPAPTFAPFIDLSAITGTADARGSMGLSVAEINGMSGKPDGLPDLFLTHWVAQENALYQSLRTAGGNLEYRDKTRQFRLGEISIDVIGWGCAFADWDCDGRTDLAVANGSTLERKDDQLHLIADPLFLFWNDGKQFCNVAPQAGAALAARHCARGLAIADFDSDGDVDIAVAVNRGQPLLLRNDTPHAGHSLKVRLKGRSAARYGAKVEVTCGDNCQTLWWGADVSYLSQHAPELIFGLGPQPSASVRVLWADGTETRMPDAAAGILEVQPSGNAAVPPKSP